MYPVQCVGAVKTGGYLVFTAETMQASSSDTDTAFPERGFKLQRNGSFAYKKSYLLDLFKDLPDVKIIMYDKYSLCQS